LDFGDYIGSKLCSYVGALFSIVWYGLECGLDIVVGVCVRRQGRSLLFSLKRARLA